MKSIPDDVRAVHARMSPVDLRFREMASTDAQCLSRDTFAKLDSKSPLLKYALQSWPTFVDRSHVRELAQVSTGLSQLIRSLPARAFDDDPSRIARYYGIDEGFAQVMIEPPNGIASALSRGDFVYGRKGFQCVEFNMTSNLGGWETGLLASMLLRVEPIARFVRESGIRISFKNTFRLLIVHVIELARREGLIDGGELNLLIGTREAEILARDPQVFQFLDHELQAAIREHAPDLKGVALVQNYADLTMRGSALYYGARRIHSVVERHVDSTDEAVFRCFKARSLNLYNGPASWILSDKRNVALLSSLAETDILLPAEQALVRDHVPWARRLNADEEARFEGESVKVESLVRMQRERFVLKKARSLGGQHVFLGRFSTAEQWGTAIDAAVASGDWIVQEYVESLPYLFQAGSVGCCPHDVVWGPFVFGSRYCGAILRVQPKALEGIVNLTRGATEGIILEVDDGTPEVT
jgi:hypothetical protein